MLLSFPFINCFRPIATIAPKSFQYCTMFTDRVNTKGEFVRKASKFRNWIRADGSTDFLPEKDRYHLYVSYACPWACRVLTLRSLKGLEDVIDVSVVHWLLGPGGWKFDASVDGATPDKANGFEYLRQVYLKADPQYDGIVTVPTLWDKKKQTIVNNESSELIEMLNSEFNEFCATPEQRALNFYPADLKSDIDEINEWVYHNINNGVYKCGFATTQAAYADSFYKLFAALDRVEDILSRKRYLTGNRITLADWRLFTTLVRFDPVYVQHFKTNKKRIVDYPNIWNYTKELYQMPGIAKTVNFEHIKNHYCQSHKQINPLGIVPLGPDVDFAAPHDRATKFP